MFRRVMRIACYIVAGIFVYWMGILAFIIGLPFKIAFIGVLCIFGLTGLVSGVVLSRFRHWKRDVGIVLASGIGTTAICVLTKIYMFVSPQFKEMFPEEFKELFPGNRVTLDFVSGVSFIVLISAVYVLLITVSKEKELN